MLKTKLFKKVKDILNEICYEEIIKVFHDDYLPKTKANEKDMESFYKHCDTKCDDDVLYKKLVSKSYGHGHRMISYLAFMFLREYPKYTNSLIPTLKEIVRTVHNFLVKMD